ncbi:MAG: tetratricopeptide repeat protein [Pyrinomonadaceae bacterium]|nr:tetratricopeptide repeat protein [Pyrinomonadaceae bacterium]
MRDTHCQECGTRLLIVVFPNSLQYDTNQVPSFYEDHLLERVTFLELRLAQVLEKLQMTYELFSGETEEFKKDHIMIQAFLKTLDEFDPQLSERFKQNQRQIYKNSQRKIVDAGRKKQLFDEIVAEHTNPNAELFKHILNHGVKLLEEDEKQAFQMLERAALLSPQNVSLYVFIAEKLFNADKFSDAKKYLERIFQHSPTNSKILMLLGAIYADEGDGERARRLLSVLANSEKTARLVDYVWGMLAAQEKNWTESIAAFKEADRKNELPELQYLIGCAYFQLKNYQSALSFLKNAVEIDENYPDAWFMKSVVYRKLGETSAESSAFEKAKKYASAGGQSLEYLKGKRQPEFEDALPFVNFHNKEKRILINSSLRLTGFFRELVNQILED